MAKAKSEQVPERQVWTVTIAAPIETVWATLVRTDEVLPFLFGTICETEAGLQPGKRMRMVNKQRKLAISVGEVLEFNPPFRFSHTISFTQVEGEQPAKTTYELKSVEGGTQLTLISEAIPGTETGRMVLGGSMIVANLKRFVETGKPAISGALIMALNPIKDLFTPERCRVEHWPLTSGRPA